MKTLNTHVNYTIWEAPYQLSLPLNISFQIPDDDPVRLVKLLIERMDLSPLYQTYSRIEKNQASPRQLLAIVIYASMNQIFSSRRIESACRRDLNFQYLLEGKPVPNHATIAPIQSEGAFSDIKANLSFRRFLSHGTENALATSIILAMAHNVLTLHHKLQSGNLGTYLYSLKKVKKSA